MKRLFLALSLSILAAAPARAQEARVETDSDTSIYDQFDNLWIDAGAGYMMPADEDSTWLLFGTLNYGFPLHEDWGLGAQAGGQVVFRDNDPDWVGLGRRLSARGAAGLTARGGLRRGGLGAPGALPAHAQ